MKDAKRSDPYFALLRLPMDHESIVQLLERSKEIPRESEKGGRLFLVFEDSGLELSFKRKPDKMWGLNAIFFKAVGAKSCGKRIYEPPYDLQIGEDHTAVQEKLRWKPSCSGPIHELVHVPTSPQMKVIGTGDRYDLELDYLHTEFDESGKLTTVTIGCLDLL